MSANPIHAASLRGIDVSADGEWADLRTSDESACPTTVRLSTRCLSELLLALPAAFQAAMQRRRQDYSLRLTYPLKGFSLHFGELGEQQSFEFVLSLHSIGGFAVSFSGPPNDLVRLAQSVLEETAQLRHPPLAS
jgi:hypothetical protein